MRGDEGTVVTPLLQSYTQWAFFYSYYITNYEAAFTTVALAFSHV